jgi:hypothetical protein
MASVLFTHTSSPGTTLTPTQTVSVSVIVPMPVAGVLDIDGSWFYVHSGAGVAQSVDLDLLVDGVQIPEMGARRRFDDVTGIDDTLNFNAWWEVPAGEHTVSMRLRNGSGPSNIVAHRANLKVRRARKAHA